MIAISFRNTCLAVGLVSWSVASLFGQAPKKPTSPTVKPPVAASYDDVEIALGGKTQKARFHIVDFGDIPAGQAQNAKLVVHNASDRHVTLDMFVWGDYLTAAWRDTDQAVITRRIIPSKASAELDVSINCTDLTKQRLQLVSLAENSVPVTTIILGYVAHLPKAVLPIITGAYQSGLGKKWSTYYTVPSGPAPFGYTYLSDSFDTAGSDPAGNGRNCGFNVDCKKIQANDSDVIWQFSIQGYEHDWSHSDSSVKAQGLLTIVYRLKDPPPPTLKMIETK